MAEENYAPTRPTQESVLAVPASPCHLRGPDSGRNIILAIDLALSVGGEALSPQYLYNAHTHTPNEVQSPVGDCGGDKAG